jgi:ATP phosphoribosyltransferase regulatory subunit
LAATAKLDAMLAALDPADPAGAERLVAQHLDAAGIAFIGARTPGEVTARLISRAADRTEAPLSGEIVELIEKYLSISGPAQEAADRIAALTSAAGLDISARLAVFRERLERMKALDCGGLDVTFSAKLGQRFEYYTDGGVPSPFASGGRYDKLLGGIGAAREVPAVGAAIYTERLLAAVAREAGAQ